MLFLDDLQFADPASLALIGYLTRRLHGTPLLLVVAWRPEEIDRSTRRRSGGWPRASSGWAG